MELLKIHPNGQWSLVEKKDDKPDLLAPKPDKPYLSYRSKDLQGQLKEDFGRKGFAAGGANNRPPRQTSDEKMEGKVPTPLKGVKEELKPGDGVF